LFFIIQIDDKPPPLFPKPKHLCRDNSQGRRHLVHYRPVDSDGTRNLVPNRRCRHQNHDSHQPKPLSHSTPQYCCVVARPCLHDKIDLIENTKSDSRPLQPPAAGRQTESQTRRPARADRVANAKAEAGRQSRKREGRSGQTESQMRRPKRADRVANAKAEAGSQCRSPSSEPSNGPTNLGVPGRSPPRSVSVHILLLVTSKLANAGTLRWMKNRHAALLRPPLY
jgi:hypothetical protein